MANTQSNNYRLVTGIGRYRDNDVVNLSLDVEDGLLNNPKFPTLPVKLTDVAAQRLVLVAAMTDARKLGKDRTLAKKAAKQALVDLLLKLAFYCQAEAHHDLEALLSTGFEVVNTNRTPGPLDTPSISGLSNSVSGQITVRGRGVVNGRMYKARTSTDGGKTWTEWPQLTGPRVMVLSPTVPGTVYMVEICALGGSTSQSAWSNPVSIMST
jgi:hypothetical protein